MAAVIEALRQEHRSVARLLDALERQIGFFARGGDPDYDVIRGVAEYFLDFPDRCHHPKEDAVFLHLKAVRPQAASAIGDLAGEHRRVHERAVRFKETLSILLGGADIARADLVEAAKDFIEDERRHMHMEDQTFFPVAEHLLTPADWTKIEGDLTQGNDPLFGGKIEERFRKLREQLIAWEQESS
jgi:hemerythrin-like domain-containing protein